MRKRKRAACKGGWASKNALHSVLTLEQRTPLFFSSQATSDKKDLKKGLKLRVNSWSP